MDRLQAPPSRDGALASSIDAAKLAVLNAQGAMATIQSDICANSAGMAVTRILLDDAKRHIATAEPLLETYGVTATFAGMYLGTPPTVGTQVGTADSLGTVLYMISLEMPLPLSQGVFARLNDETGALHDVSVGL